MGAGSPPGPAGTRVTLTGSGFTENASPRLTTDPIARWFSGTIGYAGARTHLPIPSILRSCGDLLRELSRRLGDRARPVGALVWLILCSGARSLCSGCDMKATAEHYLNAAGYTLIFFGQAYACAAMLARHIIHDCHGGDPGPGGGFSVGILSLVVTFVVGVIGYHLARFLSSVLHSRGAGPWSALGTYLILSPVLPISFWEIVPSLARATGMCR